MLAFLMRYGMATGPLIFPSSSRLILSCYTEQALKLRTFEVSWRRALRNVAKAFADRDELLDALVHVIGFGPELFPINPKLTIR